MMDELHKAAILLTHLTAPERDQILARLDPSQRTQLERMVTTAPEVSQQELVGIVAEYQSWIARLTSASGREPAEAESPSSAGPGSFLVSPDFQRLTEQLREEPATVLCAVMCCLPEAVAGDYFESLSAERKEAVVSRLPAQRDLQPIVKQEMVEFLSAPEVGETFANSPGQKLLTRLVGT